MKVGDIVALKSDRVVVQLFSDKLEKSLDVKKVHFGSIEEIQPFRRGDSAIVVEINGQDCARVKILNKTGMWWGNVSDLLVIE